MNVFSILGRMLTSQPVFRLKISHTSKMGQWENCLLRKADAPSSILEPIVEGEKGFPKFILDLCDLWPTLVHTYYY